MKLPIKFKRLSRRAKIIAVASAVVVSGSAAGAITSFQSSGAEEKPQIQVQVDDHEERISKNEADIAETKERVDQVEQKTEENTSAIGATQERVTVVERRIVESAAGQASAPAQTPQKQQSSAPSPAPEPVQPQPVNPRRVFIAVQNKISDGVWSCNYTLQDGKTIHTYQGYECHAAGTEIHPDIASMHGIN